jgi:hypothetical protein
VESTVPLMNRASHHLCRHTRMAPTRREQLRQQHNRENHSDCQSSPSNFRSVMYLTIIAGVTCGMSLSRPIFASGAAVRNRSVGTKEPRTGFVGVLVLVLVVVQRRQQRCLPLGIGQCTK